MFEIISHFLYITKLILISDSNNLSKILYYKRKKKLTKKEKFMTLKRKAKMYIKYIALLSKHLPNNLRKKNKNKAKTHEQKFQWQISSPRQIRRATSVWKMHFYYKRLWNKKNRIIFQLYEIGVPHHPHWIWYFYNVSENQQSLVVL